MKTGGANQTEFIIKCPLEGGGRRRVGEKVEEEGEGKVEEEEGEKEEKEEEEGRRVRTALERYVGPASA
eukprot:7368584-Pyramimonas_sp.AAC.1